MDELRAYGISIDEWINTSISIQEAQTKKKSPSIYLKLSNDICIDEHTGQGVLIKESESPKTS